MDMQNYTIPFANTGDKEEFSIGTDPAGKVSLEKGWTELYQLRPEEGGLFILRKVFNQMMNLVSTDTVTWKIQTFPNWIDNKGDGTPYSYPKNAIVKYTDGNVYVSKVDNNIALPTDTNNWVNFEDFGGLNINTLPDKSTPVDTDNLVIQEVGGILKKLSFANLKATLLTYFDTLYSQTTAIFGIGQTWKNVAVSRSAGVTYTNRTGKPIQIYIRIVGEGTVAEDAFVVDEIGIGYRPSQIGSVIYAVVPNNATYRLLSGVNATRWAELR